MSNVRFARRGQGPHLALGGLPEFSDKYYDLSRGDADARGPWNEGDQWQFVDDPDDQSAVDGGDGSASIKLDVLDTAAVEAFATRTASDPTGNPVTGADLGAGPGAGRTTELAETA